MQSCVSNALQRAGIGPADLAAIGITNQRETTVLWDRRTGEPVHNAIVWQDTRTDALIAALAQDGGQDRFRERCGLPLATYFSGPKVRWLLDTDPALRRAGRGRRDAVRHHGHLADLAAHRAPCHGRHQRQPYNAHESVHRGLGRPAPARRSASRAPMLPEIRPSSEVYGEAGGPLHGVPVAGALGDQQAALFGQTCFAPGDAKCTYGTGAFLLLNTGTSATLSKAGLITTVGVPAGTASRPSTRSRAPSRWPARWSSGCATTSASSSEPPIWTNWPGRCPTAAAP